MYFSSKLKKKSWRNLIILRFIFKGPHNSHIYTYLQQNMIFFQISSILCSKTFFKGWQILLSDGIQEKDLSKSIKMIFLSFLMACVHSVKENKIQKIWRKSMRKSLIIIRNKAYLYLYCHKTDIFSENINLRTFFSILRLENVLKYNGVIWQMIEEIMLVIIWVIFFSMRYSKFSIVVKPCQIDLRKDFYSAFLVFPAFIICSGNLEILVRKLFFGDQILV